MNLTSTFHQAEQNYLTPADNSMDEDRYSFIESLKDKMYDIECQIEDSYEIGENSEELEEQLNELQFQIMMLA